MILGLVASMAIIPLLPVGNSAIEHYNKITMVDSQSTDPFQIYDSSSSNIFSIDSSGNIKSDLNGSCDTASEHLIHNISTGVIECQPFLEHNVSMGEISYFSTTGDTATISAQSDGSTNTVKINATSTLVNINEFDNGGSNDSTLRFTGSTTRDYHIALTISLSPQTNNDDVVVGIAKNDVIVDASKVIMKLGSTTDTQSTALHVTTTLATNDELSIRVGNLDGTGDVTVKSINLFAMGM
jgi:hypothetical protein